LKLVVMIPAFNEEKSIGGVIDEIPRSIPGVDAVEVLVINDGSTDGTVDEARKARADRIISHKRNMGLGVTFKDGLEGALQMGADIVVNTDADGQYNGDQIPVLAKPIITDIADIVIGDRQIDSLDHMPLKKKLGNKIASWVTRRATGLPIRDAQTGFRAFSREAALRMTLSNAGYTYTQETLIEAAHKNLKVEQIPIDFRKREGHSRLISGIFRYASLAGMTILQSYRDFRPFMFFAGIGLVMIFLGLITGGYVLWNFLNTGLVNPHLPTAVLTVVFLVIGFQILIFGLMADMLKTQRMIEEETLYRMKKKDLDRYYI
jgi:glycosyltransferase involved in cell wall biosynthesis